MSFSVFVYGTLMKGCSNHGWMNGTRFIMEDHTLPIYTLADLNGLPAMYKFGETSVRGEIYEVDHATLYKLDLFEGHPSHYKREPVALWNGVGTVQAYFRYGGCPADAKVMPSGFWKNLNERR